MYLGFKNCSMTNGEEGGVNQNKPPTDPPLFQAAPTRCFSRPWEAPSRPTLPLHSPSRSTHWFATRPRCSASPFFNAYPLPAAPLPPPPRRQATLARSFPLCSPASFIIVSPLCPPPSSVRSCTRCFHPIFCALPSGAERGRGASGRGGQSERRQLLLLTSLPAALSPRPLCQRFSSHALLWRSPQWKCQCVCLVG